jgi:hypothetical protein
VGGPTPSVSKRALPRTERRMRRVGYPNFKRALAPETDLSRPGNAPPVDALDVDVYEVGADGKETFVETVSGSEWMRNLRIVVEGGTTDEPSQP